MSGDRYCGHDSPHVQQYGDECFCGCVDYDVAGAVCPVPGDERCLDQTPCSSCVSLGRPDPLLVGDEPFEDEPPGSPIFLPGGAA